MEIYDDDYYADEDAIQTLLLTHAQASFQNMPPEDLKNIEVIKDILVEEQKEPLVKKKRRRRIRPYKALLHNTAFGQRLRSKGH